MLRAQIEAARARHPPVDIALGGIERDSTIGGGMPGGALAYRLFVFLLPSALFFVVAGVGSPRGHDPHTTVRNPRGFRRDGSLSPPRLGWPGPAPLVVHYLSCSCSLYAARTLYRAIAIVHAIA